MREKNKKREGWKQEGKRPAFDHGCRKFVVQRGGRRRVGKSNVEGKEGEGGIKKRTFLFEMKIQNNLGISDS